MITEIADPSGYGEEVFRLWTPFLYVSIWVFPLENGGYEISEYVEEYYFGRTSGSLRDSRQGWKCDTPGEVLSFLKKRVAGPDKRHLDKDEVEKLKMNVEAACRR